MKTSRQYNYLIKPDEKQKKIMVGIFGAVRFLYNRYLEDVKKGRVMGKIAKYIVNQYRNEYPFLKETEFSILMNVIFQAIDKGKNLKKYKKRHDSFASFTISNLYNKPVYIAGDSFVHIPSLGNVEIIYHRPIPKDARISKATLMRKADGRYFISICLEIDIDIEKIKIDPLNSIGLDYSSPHFFVDSNGHQEDMPHFYEKRERRIAILSQKIQHCTPGSNNFFKYKQARAKQYAKITNQRDDYLHKLSTRLSNEYDVICVESINLKEIAERDRLGKRTLDNSYRKFIVMLRYKMKAKGKLLLSVDRYFPSSKTCHKCGMVYKDLDISERTWKCPGCGEVLDRDINAAINIRNKCLEDYYGRRVFGESL